eukprot:TRINITY_DN3721_c0_g1_i1.p1 TRINITY_DN3721_c0_g1~~TRINITY_DN3721_c0_g1_i1.p1  ORF type:complete len:241 (+),score=97.39 TRINITY_DN3721_c0_g1_i1:156-878(+)
MSDKVVPELVKKKTERNAELLKKRTETQAKAKEERKSKLKEYLARGEKWYKADLEAKKELVKLKRKAKKEGNYYVPPEAKVAFVVRIKGINSLHPKPRKTLLLFRLRQLHNGVFIKLNKATTQMLKLIEPYVTFGYPNVESIRKLVYKRGFMKEDGARIPIQSNEQIEKHLGKYGIICIEDLIHEIAYCGPHFKEATNFLWPFKLNPPKSGFNVKRHSFIQGGDWGNREEYINDLISKML